MKTLAIDFGSKNIGVAISDEKGIIAAPHVIIKRKSDDQALEEIKHISTNFKVNNIVIGLSQFSNLSWKRRIKSFARKIAEKTLIPVTFWDESFSTKQAQNMVAFSGLNIRQRKKSRRGGKVKTVSETEHFDAKAAAIILQEYLDHENRN